MVKIIKYGKRYEMKTICSICECEFSYEDEDIIEDDFKKVVKCPCCKRNVDPSINIEIYGYGTHGNIYYCCPICSKVYEGGIIETANFPIQCICGQLLNQCEPTT